ncbi:hypothetical protein K488DRAFT_6457, partial [Vararia minispora EC-137]
YVNPSTKLGVNPADLYNALLASAENLPPDWNLMGRQADVWKVFGYLPADLVAPN